MDMGEEKRGQGQNTPRICPQWPISFSQILPLKLFSTSQNSATKPSDELGAGKLGVQIIALGPWCRKVHGSCFQSYQFPLFRCPSSKCVGFKVNSLIANPYKIRKHGVGKVAQQLRAAMFLQRTQVWFPESTWQLVIHNSNSREYDALFQPLPGIVHMCCSYIYAGKILIHIK